MSNFWQRLVRAAALVFGVVVGVGVTVFAYSNTAPVDVGWATLHFKGVPVWTVAVVPVAVALAAGAVYHWLNNLHHFTEHMRHRRRVHELEAELASLRSHLDTALEMPDHAAEGTAPTPEEAKPAEPAEPVESISMNGDPAPATKASPKKTTVVSDTEPVAVATTEPTETEEAPAET